MSSTTPQWVSELGYSMIDYIYDGEFYHVKDGKGGITITKDKPQTAKDHSRDTFVPLKFWFQK